MVIPINTATASYEVTVVDGTARRVAKLDAMAWWIGKTKRRKLWESGQTPSHRVVEALRLAGFLGDGRKMQCTS